MIDLRALRENPEPFRASQRARGADVDLVDRLHAADAVIERGAHAPVRTSTRRDGRARQGFAGYLRQLSGARPDEVAAWLDARWAEVNSWVDTRISGREHL